MGDEIGFIFLVIYFFIYLLKSAHTIVMYLHTYYKKSAHIPFLRKSDPTDASL